MIEKITLPNGVRFVFEDIPYVRSASLGFWVGSASRQEPSELSGISHAIEHMVFKGTTTRTSAQIASEMDAIGGQINAYTTKEITCFYGRCLDSHLPIAIDLLADVFLNPKMAEQDWETERGVIMEEIGMYEDSPEDLVNEELFAKIYQGSTLGCPILGTPTTLANLTAKKLAEYRSANYTPDRIVVSLAGRFTQADKDDIIRRMGALCGTPPAEPSSGIYTPSITTKSKEIEQNHLCLAFPSLPLGSPERHTMQILNGILGSGMSSRLFQKVREQNGLCYSIYSFSAAHMNTGITGIYTALNKETEQQAIKLSCEVINEFLQTGPTDQEVDRVREQIKANVLMSLESTSSRMFHLGQNELFHNHIPSSDEIIEKFDAVTKNGIITLARNVFDFDKVSFSAVGNVANTDYAQILRSCNIAASV